MIQLFVQYSVLPTPGFGSFGYICIYFKKQFLLFAAMLFRLLLLFSFLHFLKKMHRFWHEKEPVCMLPSHTFYYYASECVRLIFLCMQNILKQLFQLSIVRSDDVICFFHSHHYLRYIQREQQLTTWFQSCSCTMHASPFSRLFACFSSPFV